MFNSDWIYRFRPNIFLGFWKYLKCDLDYYSIEVYKRSIDEIKNLKDIVDSNLSKKK